MARKTSLYVDGFTLARWAELAAEQSLNWLDLTRLARRVASRDATDTRAVYFAPPAVEDRRTAHAISCYTQALGLAGVERRFANGALEPVECLRCGHGWRQPAAHGADLDLAVAIVDDAHRNLFDEAILVADERIQASLEQVFRRQFPAKRLRTLVLGDAPSDALAERSAISLESLRACLFGPFVTAQGQAAIACPRQWRLAGGSERAAQPAGAASAPAPIARIGAKGEQALV
jgi:hypothetical protein